MRIVAILTTLANVGKITTNLILPPRQELNHIKRTPILEMNCSGR